MDASPTVCAGCVSMCSPRARIPPVQMRSAACFASVPAASVKHAPNPPRCRCPPAAAVGAPTHDHGISWLTALHRWRPRAHRVRHDQGSSSSSDNVVTLTSQAVSVSSIDKTDHCCISFTTMQLRALLMQTDHMSASRKLQGWEQPPLPTVLVRWAIAGRHRSRGEADPPCLAG